MGFPEALCDRVLERAGSLDEAVAMASDLTADLPAPALSSLPTADDATSATAPMEKVMQLAELGFTVEQSRQALVVCSGSVEAACELLLAQMDDAAAVVGTETSGGGGDDDGDADSRSESEDGDD
jgi:uncharacterized UBP type Zn finger protein